MRGLLFSGILAAMTTAAWAGGCPTSTLDVHTSSQMPIKVYVDGNTGPNPATVNVIVNGITPGTHQLRVVEVHSNRYGVRFHRTVYTGRIDVRASVYMDARVDEGQGIAIHNAPIDCDAQGYQINSATPANAPVATAAPVAASSSAVAETSPPIPVTTAAHMSDVDLKKLVTTITSSKYETKKLDTLKTTIGTSKLATDQVRQLMNLFSFESNKLAVAKLLYANTVDKQNYGALTASFNFEANKAEFKKFLAAK